MVSDKIMVVQQTVIIQRIHNFSVQNLIGRIITYSVSHSAIRIKNRQMLLWSYNDICPPWSKWPKIDRYLFAKKKCTFSTGPYDARENLGIKLVMIFLNAMIYKYVIY